MSSCITTASAPVGHWRAGEDAGALAATDGRGRYHPGGDLRDDAQFGIGRVAVRGADRVAVAERLGERRRIDVGPRIGCEHAAENAVRERRLGRRKRLRASRRTSASASATSSMGGILRSARDCIPTRWDRSTSTTTRRRRSILRWRTRCPKPFGICGETRRVRTPTARQRTTRSRRHAGQVAALIGAQPDEIVFTGGGSEASNQAIKGTCLRRPCGFLSRIIGGRSPDSVHIVTTAVEHPATLQPIEFLRRLGARVTILPVDKFGMVDPDDVKRAITPRTRLVTVMHSNNEVGTLMPIREIAAICRERGVLVHTDCASRSARCRWT